MCNFHPLISCEKEAAANISQCYLLSSKLEENIGTNGLINYSTDTVVGGTLIEIPEAAAFPMDQEDTKDIRTLTFKGYEKTGILQFKGGNDTFSYQIGKAQEVHF